MNQLAGDPWVALPCHVATVPSERDHHQIGVLGRGGMPGHDPLGVDVDDERDVGEPRPRPYVVEVRTQVRFGGGAV